ncbi:Hypothetical protein NTJ_08559 [Nesidiocoris tenuis]|uniref:DUF4219 domain-containing protein n=1 Tax=Nesidiocoris tenuis TaxID=355587 RepID=A0ABN7AU97_9HEMI|nr:Hypothetical protein NTJ_08559 [Nesidiocoris tenuis]
MSSQTARIELLGKDNFDTWKLQVEAVLVKNDELDYVLGTKTRPATEDGGLAWDIADQKAKADLILSISPREVKQIKGCLTSNDVWVKLHSIFQSKGPARKASLLKQLILQKNEIIA